jgi:hypothetical protein
MGRILGRLALSLLPLAFGYFVCSLVFWWKGAPIFRAVLSAAAWATGFLALLFVILLISQARYLGLKGL